MAKKSSPGLMVRESMEYPFTLTAPLPSSLPSTALLISSSVKFIENFASDRFVVKRERLIADLLIRFVALARNHDGVARLRALQCRTDGGASVRNHKVGRGLQPLAIQANLDFLNDLQWIFAARIVRGYNHGVCAARGRLPHQGTLRPIAIAATTEDND